MKEKLKRTIALALAAGLAMSLAACGSSSSEDTEDEDSSTAESAEAADEEEAEETEEDASATEEEISEEAETEEEEESSDEDDGDPIYGGTLTMLNTEFSNTSFDPAGDAVYVYYFCDMLWNIDWYADRDEVDYTNNYIDIDHISGQLAESWEIADDYSSMTVYLRDDVYFQDKSEAGLDDEYDIYDGRQLVASDVKWSYDRLLGLDGTDMVEIDSIDWETNLSMLESVEVVDDFTVVFNFNTTDELSVENFMCSFVNIAGPEWDELTEDQQSDWHYASGTGPFILTDYILDNSMTFTRNDNYWGTDEDGNQLPYLDEVVLIYVSDSTTRLSSFISGEIDIMAIQSSIFDSDEITQLEESLDEDEYDSYSRYTAPYAIGLKQGNNPVEALTSGTVREAMQYALDIEAISEYMGYSYSDDEASSKLSGVFGTGTAWCDVDNWGEDLISSYTTYDSDYAMELLEEAGYADGFEFDVTIFSSLSTDPFTLAAEYLADVGITLNLTVGTSPADMTSVGTDEDSSGSAFYNLSMTKVTNLSTSVLGTSDFIHADNEEIENLALEVLNATTLDEQIAAAKELDVAYMSEHYLLYLTYNEENEYFARSYVKGYSGECRNEVMGFVAARLWLDDSE